MQPPQKLIKKHIMPCYIKEYKALKTVKTCLNSIYNIVRTNNWENILRALAKLQVFFKALQISTPDNQQYQQPNLIHLPLSLQKTLFKI